MVDPLTPDEPESTYERFTEGDCHILARAIHLQTGWMIATFMDMRWPEKQWPDLHAFVQMPDGRFLDIEGIADEPTIRRRWRADTPILLWTWEEMSTIKFWNVATWPRESYVRAAVEARALLERYA